MPTSKKPAAAPAAPAKKTSTAVAVKKNTAGNIVSIKEALQAQAAAMGNRIQPATGNMIRLSTDKKFTLPDGTKTADPLQLVIVDFVATSEFYEGAFDKDNIVPPGCFAVGINPRELVPSDNVPNRQADNCQVCPMNQWGSDGAGKACKNGRLLAVLPPDADEDTPMWLLKVSPTAVKNFDGFVQSVVRVSQMPPVAMVVTVSFNDAVTYVSLEFSDPQPNEQLAVHYGRMAEAQEMLNAPRDVTGYVPIDDAPKAKAKPAAKKVAGRR